MPENTINDVLKNISDSDQVAAAVKSAGQTFAAYYQSQIDAGLPRQLAAQLTRDWHRLCAIKALWPDSTPGVDIEEE